MRNGFLGIVGGEAKEWDARSITETHQPTPTNNCQAADMSPTKPVAPKANGGFRPLSVEYSIEKHGRRRSNHREGSVRRFLLLMLVSSFLVTSCGGGVGSAENCTELTAIATEEAEKLEGDQDALDALFLEGTDRAEELGGEALASGANLEAALCANIARELRGSHLQKTFEDIATELEDIATELSEGSS